MRMEKGAGVSSAPLYLLFLLYQLQPTYTDNFSDFICLTNSSTYVENRLNRGLTRFAEMPGGDARRSIG